MGVVSFYKSMPPVTLANDQNADVIITDDDYVIQQYQQGLAILEFMHKYNIFNGQLFIFTIDGHVYKYMQQPSNWESLTIEQWLRFCRSFLLGHPNIYNNFDITISENRMSVYVKKQSATSFSVNTYENYSTIILYRENNQLIKRDNFYLGMQFIKNGFPYMPKFVKKAKESTEIYSSPTLAGYAKFNFENTFSDVKERKFTFPESGDVAILHDLSTKLQIYAFNRYSVDGVISENDGAFSEESIVLQGKLDNIQMTELNRVNRNFYSHFISRRKFLTWAPRVKTTDIYMPEKLYLCVPSITQNTPVIFYADIYFSDNSEPVLQRELGTVFPNSHDILEFQCSFQKIYRETDTRISYYDVYFTAIQSYPLTSEKYRFVLDYSYQQYARYFIYKNNCGVYEVIRTTGKCVKEISVENKVGKAYPEKVYDYSLNNVQISNSLEFNMVLNTGYLKADWLTHLREFISSNEIYQLKFGRIYPVLIDKTKITVHDDGEFLKSVKLSALINHFGDDFKTDFDIDFATPEIPVYGDFNNDFNEDFF